MKKSVDLWGIDDMMIRGLKEEMNAEKSAYSMM